MTKTNREELMKLNGSYDREHTLTDSDIDMANIYIKAIEASRSRLGRPQVGDILLYNGYRAHIETLEGDMLYICEQPYTPFISCSFADSNSRIKTNTSGGIWRSVPASKAKATDKKANKEFCFFGHCGIRGNGAVAFTAEVDVYEYND